MKVRFVCDCGNQNNSIVERVIKTTSTYLLVKATCSDCMTTHKIRAFKDPNDYGKVGIYSDKQ